MKMKMSREMFMYTIRGGGGEDERAKEGKRERQTLHFCVL